MPASRYLRDCALILSRSSSPAGRRLVAAGKLFWKGAVESEDWPDPVKERVAGMIKQLIDAGVIGSGNLNISEVAAAKLCEDLRDLVADFAQAMAHTDHSIERRASRSGGFAMVS